MMYTRVSSGLDFLDAAIGGLFSQRSYLLRGPSQSGRTTAALQFLLAGLDNNESVMMISSDRIENVILKAEAIGISLEPYLVENRLVLIEYPQEIINGNFQYGAIINLLGEIERYIEHYNCSRLVFDTLIPLLANPHEAQLVNYIYSLMNSLEAMNTTTMAVIGEPSSPMAIRITQLIEDAVVGSFSLTVKTQVGPRMPTQVQSGYVLPNPPSNPIILREFFVHKMVNPITPPTSFKVRFDYGVGIVQDIGLPSVDKATSSSGKSAVKTIAGLPLNVMLIDRDEECSDDLLDIFNGRARIDVISSREMFYHELNNLHCDLVILNSGNSKINWREKLTELRRLYPQMPIFLITNRISPTLSYQSAKQSGADALFVRPISPEDFLSAFEATLKKYGILDNLIEKYSYSNIAESLPEDFGSSINEVASVDDVTSNLIPPQLFNERIQRWVLRSAREQTKFSLVGFKMIYAMEMGRQHALPQGLEMVKKIATIITISLRGVNDIACRHMDKTVVLLENTDRAGAEAFARRVAKQIKDELATKFNIQLGREMHLLTAFSVYPDDANNANDLFRQVTDVTRNFIKNIAV